MRPTVLRLSSRLVALLVTAVGVTALISYLAGGALDIGDVDGNRTFSLGDDPWQQSSASALDTPFAMPWLPSSVVSRASIAVALGRKSALRDFGAAAAALTCVLVAVLLHQCGVSLFPVLLATLAMAFGATFWDRGVSWSSGALAPVWAMAAALAGRRWLAVRDSRFAAAATVAAALAIVEDPSWAACLPAAALFVRARTTPSWRHSAVIGFLSILAVAGVLLRLDVIRHAPWVAILHVEAPSLLSMWGMETGDGWMPIASLASREFTAVGQILLAAGAAVAWQMSRDRLALAALIAGAVAIRYAAPQLQPGHAGSVIAIVGWSLVAVGLEWLSRTVGGYGPIATGIAGLLLIAQPATTHIRMAAIHEASSPAYENRLAAELKITDLAGDQVVVANSRKGDASVLLSASLSNSPLVLLPQRAELVDSAVAERRRPLAFPGAQTHLGAAGFLFERFFAGNVPLASVAGRQACTPLVPNQWADVSLQLDGGSFSVRSGTPSAAGGRVSIYLAAPRPIMVTDRDRVETPYESRLLADEAAAEARQRVEAAGARGGGINGWPITAIDANPSDAPVHATFALSEIPQAAIAVSTVAPLVTLCAASARTAPALESLPHAAAHARLIDAGTFGVGWHSAEGGLDTFRWTSAPESSVRARVNTPGNIRVTVTAMPAALASARPFIGLTVNGCALADQPLPGLNDISWVAPPDCWKPGSNQLWLRSGPLVSPASLGYGGDTRQLGARVSAVRLERVAP